MGKIPSYPSLTAPDDNDELIIEDSNSSSTKKITRGDLLSGTPLPADTVDSQAIANNAVTTNKILNDAVTTAKILDSNVTTAKLASGAVTPAKRAGGHKVGTISLSATGSGQAFTGVGFQPKMVQFFYERATTSTSNQWGYGASDGSTTFASSGGSSSAGHATLSNTTASINAITGGNSNTLSAVLTSLDSDGFTLNVTVLSAGPHSVGYLALG